MDRKERDELLSRFSSGYTTDAYRLLGCHDEGDGTYSFRVWAPDARAVAIVGDFNGWDKTKGGAFHIGGGVFEAILEGVQRYDNYKICITRADGTDVLKCDPYATHAETRPATSSKVFDIGGFSWTDAKYLAAQKKRDVLSSPVNIYEVHIGSWRRYEDGNFFSYRHFADEIVEYLKEMHYTHLELMPVSEYPFDPSWGYQVTGYYAPTSRYGTPHDFMYLVDKCHAAGIGVIVDWVPAHFPKDEVGLYEFDGSYLYESNDPVMNEHPDWGTRIFNYDRNEVRSFLISNACYWLKEYHVDGIRVDAVASMLYLDYGRGGREWHPNAEGGNYNLHAIEFLKAMNHAAFSVKPSALMIAEESTAFPGVTKPPYLGGLGFNFKWNMGWMNDTLRYMSTDPLFRKEVHGTLTFTFHYAHAENYILPLSHDEVVHLKNSMIGKMPGDYDQKFANLRALYAYMVAFPGKMLSFMGNEIGQFREWSFDRELDWSVLAYERHRELRAFVSALGEFYLKNPCLWELDTQNEGFSFISADDSTQSILVFRRIDKRGRELIAVCNFCPVAREDYRIGVPYGKRLLPVFSSAEERFGGEGMPTASVKVEDAPLHGLPLSASLFIPPMSVTFYKIRK